MLGGDQRLLMLFPRSRAGSGLSSGWALARARMICVALAPDADRVRPTGPSPAGRAVTCSDDDHGAASRVPGVRPPEHGPELDEPSSCPVRFSDAGRFVHADVAVICSIRFCLRARASW